MSNRDENLLEKIERALREEGLLIEPIEPPAFRSCLVCESVTEAWSYFDGGCLQGAVCDGTGCYEEADQMDWQLDQRVKPLQRHVRLPGGSHAFFLEPDELWVMKPGVMDSLPYFDPDLVTEERVLEKLGMYIIFS